MWSRAIASLIDCNVMMDGSSRKSNCGHEKKNLQKKLLPISDIPLNRRGTIHSTSAAFGIPIATLLAHLKEGRICYHTNAVKPLLTR